MIRIRFVTGKDFVSNAIRVGERDGWATHVEAVMPDGTLLGAHLDGGVQARPADYDKGTRTRELVIELTPTAVVPVDPSIGKPFVFSEIGAMENTFYRFLYSQVGKPYDTLGVVGAGLGRDWREPDSWFCSELLAAALESCGYLPKLSASDNHISPRDLLLVLSGRVEIKDAA